MLELAIGTLLAVGALAVVLYPLFAGVARTPFRTPRQPGIEHQSPPGLAFSQRPSNFL